MKVIDRNIMLKIELLKPHPDNPRKDVGDVTELAESIKANGIFQNLTVLKDDCLDGYTVLIGHRRLAAAKLAGLEEVPCMVVEMDKREQISTMLLENMQRSDLTVWEQAQGFQMMLDLGETEDGIAEKTGFSKTTIRHRIKLLELDPEEFKKSQEKQPTMADYIELEKISDLKERSEALKSIGTDNFKWAVSTAKRKVEENEAHKEWDKLFKELGLEKYSEKLIAKKESVFGYEYISYNSKPKKDVISRIKKAVKDGKAKGYAIQYSGLHILGADKPKGKNTKTPKEKALDAKIREIKKLESQAKALREEFVKSYSGGNASYIIQAAIDSKAILYTYSGRDKKLKEYLNIKDEGTSLKDIKSYCYLLGKHPEIVLFAYVALEYECDNHRISLLDMNGKYQRCTRLETWYNILEYLGYQVSDDEKALLDGTHKCFEEE